MLQIIMIYLHPNKYQAEPLNAKNACKKITVFFPLNAASAISNSTFAENLEIVLKDKLDGNLSGYCLNIVGGGNNINPADGLQAQTCYRYRRDLGSDQAIDSKQSSEQGVCNLTEFKVCMTFV
ncbi:MAG: hypothetical protein KTR16_11050 [Acidiferrobacterales bacterium]|nr:hypothetical protein [Acidiferrobacterales bacterium]